MDELEELLGKIHNKALEIADIIEEMGSWRDLEFVASEIRELRDLSDSFLKHLEVGNDCKIELAFADPCTEVYVCWNHRRIWEIDTTYIGSQLDNPPKTCEECKILVEKAKEAEKKAEQEVKELEPDDWE